MENITMFGKAKFNLKDIKIRKHTNIYTDNGKCDKNYSIELKKIDLVIS